jgi:hypothetical protein
VYILILYTFDDRVLFKSIDTRSAGGDRVLGVVGSVLCVCVCRLAELKVPAVAVPVFT